MKNFQVLVGQRIRVLRTVSGLTQEELGFRASICPNHLGQIERAVKNPTITTLYKISEALEVPLSELLNLETPLSKLQVNKDDKEDNIVINKILAQLSDMSVEEQEDILKIIKIFKHRNK